MKSKIINSLKKGSKPKIFFSALDRQSMRTSSDFLFQTAIVAALARR